VQAWHTTSVDSLANCYRGDEWTSVGAPVSLG
jgi:hypothetical protein